MWHDMSFGQHGPITLHEDGTFTLGNFPITPGMTLENCRCGDSVVNKPAGPDQPITIKAPDATHYFLFGGDSRWRYRKEARGFFARMFNL